MFSAAKTAGPSGYNISRSVRLRSSASAYFNRTPASAGNRKTWTWSAWVKRGSLDVSQYLFSAGTGGTDVTQNGLNFQADNTLRWTGAATVYRQSTQVFRDPSAWYHIVLQFDTTQATANDRIRLYVNNVQITAFGTLNNPTQNLDYAVNQAATHEIGRWTGASNPFDGYLTEINFIDGQALTPSSFGSTNATTGVWQPAKYTGTYGTNGFYLNFSDNSGATATTIGKDYSGNGNNWTPNNISVTAGTTYDSMVDVPTPYADGSTGRGNYAVWSPIDNIYSSNTISNGNLRATTPVGANYGPCKSTFGMSTGKWYWECVDSSGTGSSGAQFGIVQTVNVNDYLSNQALSVAYNGSNGAVSKNASNVTTVAAFNQGDIVGLAFDADALTLAIYKNNSLLTTVTSITAGTWFAAASDATSIGGGYLLDANFGQRPFSYTPPSGFKALNTYNLPASTILNGGKYMAATTYTGTGASQSVTNAGSFKPDLVWIKSRSAATDHKLTDSVRGTTKALISDTTGAETTDTNGLTAFGSAGFTVGSDTTYNNNTATYVGWQWQAGQGTTSSNTSGSITSTVSVNQTAGFSIVTYTGTGANATVGHGLGVAPKMVIIKSRSSAVDWLVYHAALGNPNYIVLNTTAAAATNAAAWNNTSPTSSVFTVGTGTSVNANAATYVAYLFAEVAGFSKFGSYTGNGSADGPFVYLGFRPRWVLFKRSDSTSNWLLYDTSRLGYNQSNNYLLPDLSNAEGSGDNFIDILSNGFKVRIANQSINTNGATYIYAAFAENPFQNSLAR